MSATLWPTFFLLGCLPSQEERAPGAPSLPLLGERFYGRMYVNEGALIHGAMEMGVPTSLLDITWGTSGRGMRNSDGIFKALWVWAQRRHRHKTRWWIKEKYWPSAGPNRWVFTGILKGEEGQIRVVRLLSADSIRIERHTKIRAEANPYDPAWEPYFEKRLDVQTVGTLKGKRWLLHLWKEQGGLCPICHQKITKITGWHSHHVLWRSKGGSDRAENRVLLHPTCHQQVHSQGLHVEKPRPVKRAK
ncbi:HNH endonuclease [Ktedonobacter sp. SOSP1-52]|uniref:HNH endonuclease n=1 Tax=Ktedonobacter sp. SOSP1-52 TaxID=2778366 RepID=UPI001F35AAC9|nr:HNH endonuclease [Ktedonobacter sp. SOSP1-52]